MRGSRLKVPLLARGRESPVGGCEVGWIAGRLKVAGQRLGRGMSELAKIGGGSCSRARSGRSAAMRARGCGELVGRGWRLSRTQSSRRRVVRADRRESYRTVTCGQGRCLPAGGRRRWAANGGPKKFLPTDWPRLTEPRSLVRPGPPAGGLAGRSRGRCRRLIPRLGPSSLPTSNIIAAPPTSE